MTGSRIGWATAGVVLLVAAARLWATHRSGDASGTTTTVSILAVLLVIVATLAWAVRAAGRCARNAARHRPGALVVPGFTTAEMPRLADAAGARAKGWLTTGGSPVAIVAVPGGFEVWGPRDAAPRWTVRAVPGGVAVREAVFGSRRAPAVWLSDGAAQAALMPAYRPLRATGGRVGADVQRAVDELTSAVGAGRDG
ncbi:MAG: hypothetical protein FWF90_03480 [Promicromonosporaceae bacterium]|nr:hypothetical protein [Promicromonosporaceae bacterium]